MNPILRDEVREKSPGVYEVFTADAFMDESIYERVAEMTGLGSAGAVRMTCPTSSGFDKESQLWRHIFIY